MVPRISTRSNARRSNALACVNNGHRFCVSRTSEERENIYATTSAHVENSFFPTSGASMPLSLIAVTSPSARSSLSLSHALFLSFSLPLSFSHSSLQTRILLRTVSRQTSLTDFTPVDFHDPPAPPSPPSPPSSSPCSTPAPLPASSVPPPLFGAFRAPLQLPLSSANRFKSSGSHRHAHKTRAEEKKRRMKERRKRASKRSGSKEGGRVGRGAR